ncbi:MAG: polysaccharide biosynthesis tyrosine autokinase [Verrucomicrobiota bacterium]
MTKDTSEAKLHAMDYWQVLRNRYGVILLAFALVFMTAAVITYILPRQYSGKVQLQINREPSDLKIFDMGMAPGRAFISPQFIETQFKIISSKETLSRVVEALGLDEHWDLSVRDAYSQLKDNLNTNAERGTDIINIEYFDTDASMAANIANSVAENYQSRRREDELLRARNAMDTLKAEVNKQEEKVESARLKMLDLQRTYDIVDLGAMSPHMRSDETVTGMGNLYQTAMGDSYSAEAAISQIKNQIEILQGLNGDQLIRSAVGLELNNVTINMLWPELQQLEVERESLGDLGYGAKHPKVIATNRKVVSLRAKLEDAVDSVRKTLATKLEMAQKSYDSTRDMEGQPKAATLEERNRLVEYNEARKDYDLQKSMLANMETKFATESVDLQMPKTPMIVHESAEPSDRPAKPNVPLNLVLGAIVGLAFGMGLAFFLEYLDTSVKTLEDVERYLQVPVLAVIPRDVGVLHKQSGLTPDAEAYRILRTNIEFNRKSADANSITVVSGGAGEGKSTTLVNLAYICAQGGYNTLMIDGDLRRPKLHTFFDINNSVGLTNYLTTELMLEDVILQTPVDNLYFMPSGILPADAAGILNSRRMSELIAEVKNRFDLVLIDSPPILGVSDAAVLASEVDLTMVVIQHRKLPRSMLIRVKQAIENVGGNLLGVVLNNVDVRSDSQYQYYTSYYTYYSPTNTQTRSRRKDRPSTDEAAPARETAARPSRPAEDEDEY